MDVSGELARIMNVGESELPRKVRESVAVELYREQVISLGKAAELAEISVAEMMEVLAERRVPLSYGRDDFEADRNVLKEVLG